MASEQDDAVFDHALDDDDDNDESQSQDEEEEEEEDLVVNDDVLINEDDDDDDDADEDLNSPSAETNTTAVHTAAPAGIAIPVAVPAPSSAAPSAVTVASVPNGEDGTKHDSIIETAATTTTTTIVQEEKKPPAILDDTRRLFQRLWTDEDEIELLQGFLDYTTQRGGSGSGGGAHHHHHDTALFYDQIKSKLQLDFNKNQLVEKLRRLKKKYRNVVNKISSGKEFSFKSAHDQATFEISRKIWGDTVGRGGAAGGAAVDDTVLDDEETNNAITNMNFYNIEVKSEDFGGEKKAVMTPGSSKSRPRKRSRSKLDTGIDDKRGLNDGLVANNNSNNSNNENSGGAGNGSGNGNVGVVAAGVIEDTVRSCLSPLFKELLSGAMMGMGVSGVGVYGGRGIGGLAMNAMPLNFGMPASSIGCGEVSVDERWRKQQILELEVYSKRLELVQDQIKAALEELRSIGG